MECIDETTIAFGDRWGASSAINNTSGDIITFGGFSYNSGLMNDMWMLNENNYIKIKYESLYNPTPRMFANLEYYDNNVYLSNGLQDLEHKFRNSCGLSDFWKFDFKDCSWTLINNFDTKCSLNEKTIISDESNSLQSKIDTYFGILIGFVIFLFISFVIFVI